MTKIVLVVDDEPAIVKMVTTQLLVAMITRYTLSQMVKML
jgi:hypothetical protein